jgi:hypothetical protein
MKANQIIRLLLVFALMACCASCGQFLGKDAHPSPAADGTSTVQPPGTETPDSEVVLEDLDLRQIDGTCWYSGVLGATLDFPDEWEGLFTLETNGSQVSMHMVPPTDYGGLLCFFQRESQSDWAGAQNNMPVWIKLVAESDDYVIVMTRPGDEQAAPEYREQYYEIANRLEDIIVAFDKYD